MNNGMCRDTYINELLIWQHVVYSTMVLFYFGITTKWPSNLYKYSKEKMTKLNWCVLFGCAGHMFTTKEKPLVFDESSPYILISRVLCTNLNLYSSSYEDFSSFSLKQEICFYQASFSQLFFPKPVRYFT